MLHDSQKHNMSHESSVSSFSSANSKQNKRERRSSNEIPVQFIEVEPFYKHLLRQINPLRYLQSFKSTIEQKHAYGPPYTENTDPLLLTSFFQDVQQVAQSKEISPILLSIHECLSEPHRINPNLKNERDGHNTPLHYAAKGGHTTLAKMLLRAGADVSAANGLGQTAFHLSASGRSHRHERVLRLLLLERLRNDNDDDVVGLVDRAGITALERAIEVGNAGSVSVLLDRNKALYGEGGLRLVLLRRLLSKALRLRAERVGMSVDDADNHFRQLEKQQACRSLREQWEDRVRKRGLCSSENIIVEMLREACGQDDDRRANSTTTDFDDLLGAENMSWACCCFEMRRWWRWYERRKGD